MLNISKHPIKDSIFLRDYASGRRIYYKRYYKYFNRFSIVFYLFCLSYSSTMDSEYFGFRVCNDFETEPTSTNIAIPDSGRVEAWYVEGAAGDTILRVSEVKSTYFDDKLLERTRQITSKSQSVTAYQGKLSVLSSQLVALEKEQKLKLQQAENKLLQSV